MGLSLAIEPTSASPSLIYTQAHSKNLLEKKGSRIFLTDLGMRQHQPRLVPRLLPKSWGGA